MTDCFALGDFNTEYNLPLALWLKVSIFYKRLLADGLNFEPIKASLLMSSTTILYANPVDKSNAA